MEKRRKRSLIFIIITAFIFAGLSFGQNRPDAVKLEFSPAPGTNLAYSLNSLIRVEGKDFLGKDMTLGGTAAGEIRLRVDQISTEQVFTSLTSPGIRVTVNTLDGTEDYVVGTKEGAALQVVFSRRGRVDDIRNPEVLRDRDVMNFSIPDILRNYFPALPESPVRVGDSWTEHKRLFIPFQGMNLDVQLDIRFTLNSLQRSQAGRTAVISADYTVSLAGSRDLEGLAGFFKGKGTGSGVLYFLADKNYFSEYRLEYKIGASLEIKKGETTLVEWPLGLVVSASLDLAGGR